MPRTKSFLLLFCFILVAPALSFADEKTEAVNQQLNMVENEFSNAVHADDAGKEFPNAEPDPLEKSPGLKNFVKTRAHTLDLGSEIFYYRYQEPNVGVKIWGPMYGFYAGYAYRPAGPHSFNNFLTNVYMAQARFATSRDLEYKGSGILKNKHDDAWEFRGLVGKDYFVGTNSRVTPYFGFGYRYLFDRGNGQLTSTNNYAYDRKSHYYYLPLGGDWTMAMPHDWDIDFNAEYDIFLYGLQKSYLSDGDQFNHDHNPNIANSQHKGFGVRGSIKFLKRGSVVDFYVEPYIRYWNIKQSKTVTATVDGSVDQLVEPKNNTIEVGSRFGIQF